MEKKLISRTYKNIKGVDFSREDRNVDGNRAPMIVNMYKDYSVDSDCLVTREGFRLLCDLSKIIMDEEDKRVYGIHFFTKETKETMLVHVGRFLYVYEGFTEEWDLERANLIYDDMNRNKSLSFMNNNRLYINDKKRYLRYDGDGIVEVSNRQRIKDIVLGIDKDTDLNLLDVPFIPTTSISKLPLGAGESYQSVNVLNPFRKNSFCADGKEKVYQLDTLDLTTDDLRYLKIWINDIFIDPVNGTQISYEAKNEESEEIESKQDIFKVEKVDIKNARITFNIAPPMADSIGSDNVVIMFYKEVEEYFDRIDHCALSCVFDNRVFFSGNDDYKNALFHSELNDCEYIADINYYQDGNDSDSITSLCAAGNVLWVFKDSRQGDNNLFYHKQTKEEISITDIDGNTKKNYYFTYPSKQAKSSIGSFGCSINFKDDVCFLSDQGLFGLKYSDLNQDIYSSNFLCERSSLIAPVMIRHENYKDASMEIYKGYLCILIDGDMYLANSLDKYKSIGGYEYEWFYFKNIEYVKEDSSVQKGVCLKVFDERMYFGTKGGQVLLFDKNLYMDCGREIENYIVFKSDNFDDINHLKTTSKKGGIMKIKVMNNSAVCVYVRTNKEKNFKYVTTYKNSGFNFLNMDFNSLSFLLNEDNNYKVVKTKQKKFNEMQIMLKGEGEDKKSRPFGFFSFTIEAFKGNYIKR